MPLRIVRLGEPRKADEGLRLGTVRRPPRGVPKADYAPRNFYDVWFPTLAPAAATLRTARAAKTLREWRNFERTYRAEMRQPAARAALDLLAALSHRSNFSVGCYCADEARCHRRILRELLLERGAAVAEEGR
jgi:uncharacterized protein YeaO (DUF488 family)